MVTNDEIDDITWCANELCPKAPKCGRSVLRIMGLPHKVWMYGYKPDENGNCDREIPMPEDKGDDHDHD